MLNPVPTFSFSNCSCSTRDIFIPLFHRTFPAAFHDFHSETQINKMIIPMRKTLEPDLDCTAPPGEPAEQPKWSITRSCVTSRGPWLPAYRVVLLVQGVAWMDEYANVDTIDVQQVFSALIYRPIHRPILTSDLSFHKTFGCPSV